jgi:hypothetical protein
MGDIEKAVSDLGSGMDEFTKKQLKTFLDNLVNEGKQMMNGLPSGNNYYH